MPIKHIIITKSGSESNMTTLRRFTKKVQESRLLQKVKSERYASRTPSKLTLKKNALRRNLRQKEMMRLKKLGKIAEDAKR